MSQVAEGAQAVAGQGPNGRQHARPGRARGAARASRATTRPNGPAVHPGPLPGPRGWRLRRPGAERGGDRDLVDRAPRHARGGPPGTAPRPGGAARPGPAARPRRLDRARDRLVAEQRAQRGRGIEGARPARGAGADALGPGSQGPCRNGPGSCLRDRPRGRPGAPLAPPAVLVPHDRIAARRRGPPRLPGQLLERPGLADRDRHPADPDRRRRVPPGADAGRRHGKPAGDGADRLLHPVPRRGNRDRRRADRAACAPSAPPGTSSVARAWRRRDDPRRHGRQPAQRPRGQPGECNLREPRARDARRRTRGLHRGGAAQIRRRAGRAGGPLAHGQAASQTEPDGDRRAGRSGDDPGAGGRSLQG